GAAAPPAPPPAASPPPPAPAAPSAAEPVSRPAPGSTVTVAGGETLFAISRRTGVPVRALIDANDLRAPYQLLTGQKITVPATRFHEVQPGETLYSVSRRFDVAMSVLVRENDLQAPYGLRSGQRLKIPPAAETPPETVVAAAPAAGVLRLPQSPQPGQVLRLPPSAQPPAPEEPPAPQTGFLTPPPGAVPVDPGAPAGPEPVLPPSRPARPQAQPEEPVAPAPEAPARPARPQRPERAPPAVAMVPPPSPQAPPPAVVAPPPPPPADAGAPPQREGRFVWPVRGRVLTRFGPTGRGLHNDGINIAAPPGSTVVAAEAGVVAYAGNELRGFGNLLLIKHADGWITAYAHNDSLLVRRGDRVRRGQPIAKVGQTGNVGEPQLHFELRRGTRAIDPAEYLGGQASRLERREEEAPAG
ncbi:peptidoglycan DD-metalloendopeptidase family protein, partial [Stella sp.]|uniref:peptidoglycan DD-metalloendopeptidase family protein n=1 Tax=Stella sp. TaxID=2912054 RepID=UPI0035AFFC4B